MSRIAVVLAMIVSALTLSVTSASAGLDKYWDNVWCCTHQYPSGNANWTLNEIWRPSGYTIALWYENVSGTAGYMRDTFNNPAKDFGPFGYSRGYCQDWDGNSFLATCQASY